MLGNVRYVEDMGELPARDILAIEREIGAGWRDDLDFLLYVHNSAKGLATWLHSLDSYSHEVESGDVTIYLFYHA